MRILSLNTQQTFEIEVNKPGENPMPCPECGKSRKHKTAKSFSWNQEIQAGYCQNCQARFVPFSPMIRKIDYVVPEWKNKTDLSNDAVKYFEGRMICQDTLKAFKIYTDKEFMPQVSIEIDVICFPYFYNEILINTKYRGKNKSFKLIKDAELIFYNIDCVKEYEEIIITEGEIDALSFYNSGLKNVISVPNGANVKCEYIDNYFELFKNKKIILAVDNDLPGLQLKNELIRRFGSENCSTINFKECKDANEYLKKYGGLELNVLYNNRQEIPVKGIINLENCYDDIYSLYLNGLQPGLGINDELDGCLTWETSRVAVWTGIPSHGKSEVVDWFSVQMNKIHDWKTAFFSPENYPIKYHYSKLASKLSLKSFSSNKMQQSEFESLFEYMKNNFFFIYPEDNFTLDTILEKAKYLIQKHGIKNLVLDPYNKFEHLRGADSETDYISKFLDKLTLFAQRNDVLINLVAHPTKMKKDKDGLKYIIPDLYDIAGSAHFFNKPDYGLSIYREYGHDEHVKIIVQKVKFRHLGTGGVVRKKYNVFNGNLDPYSQDISDMINNEKRITSERDSEPLTF
jgi:twinkle protein